MKRLRNPRVPRASQLLPRWNSRGSPSTQRAAEKSCRWPLLFSTSPIHDPGLSNERSEDRGGRLNYSKNLHARRPSVDSKSETTSALIPVWIPGLGAQDPLNEPTIQRVIKLQRAPTRSSGSDHVDFPVKSTSLRLPAAQLLLVFSIRIISL